MIAARARLGLATRDRALLGGSLLAYGATFAMHGPWAAAHAVLEPCYLGLLGVMAFVYMAVALLAPRFAPVQTPLLLLAALAIHATVILGLVPAGADLPFHVGIVAVAAVVARLPSTMLIAVLLGALQLGVAAIEQRLTLESATLMVLPLLVTVLSVGPLARALEGRRRRAEMEVRRFKALSDQLELFEEDAASRRVSEPEVVRRRSEATMRLDSELELVLALVKRTLGATCAALFDLDAEHDVLRPRHAESEGPFERDCAIAVGRGPVGWVALKGQPFVTPERRVESSDPGYRGKGPFPRSVAAAPVKRGETVTGVLVVDHPDAGAFTSGDLVLLADFARWISALMESAGVLRHQQEEAEKFRSLHDASQRLSRSLALGELVKELLSLGRQSAGFDRAYVIYREEPSGMRVLAAEGEGATAADEVYRADSVCWGAHLLRQDRGFILELEGEKRPMPLVSPKESSGPFKSILGVPIRMKGETVGGILMAARERSYRAREQQLLEILANQAAYAVDNARLYQRMEEMATTDGLTGLFNHRYFQEALDRELDRAERHGGRLAVLLLDIDHFKKMNDTYGHPAGDQVLRTLAQILRTTARKTDIVARYGGEEFVVILPDTDERRGGELAARIRKAVRGHAFMVDGQQIRVTISIGVACHPDDARVKSELIDCADKALYHSKGRGRDQWNAYRKVKSQLVDRKARE